MLEETLEKDATLGTNKNLFRRVPILRAMFVEVILSQCLSSLLNFQFMVKIKEAIVDDEDRASWTGQVSYLCC
jgi:ATP/ADP translocase